MICFAAFNTADCSVSFDEIWFVNKRKTGESDIYSLEEYNTRFDQKIDKAYLEGRYGGVPIFNTIFPMGED